MRYIIDNDLHIHTRLSLCSDDDGQTPAAILANAKALGLKEICVTDHYWDETVPCNTVVNEWYEQQNHAHICESLPLPMDDEIRFMFGCEADMDSDDVIGLSPERYDQFDFIIVSTTHIHHMSWGKDTLSNKEMAQRWIDRFDAVLNSSLPFGRVGIAHLACELINIKSREDYIETIKLIPQEEMERLFTKAAAVGLGIELNSGEMNCTDEEAEVILRIYRTAKACGCKFYLASDAHERPFMAAAMPGFEKFIDALDLKESDKFKVSRRD